MSKKSKKPATPIIVNIRYINKVAPRHDRTSCSDESPSNARYKEDDFGGCYRCTLLRAASPVNTEDESEDDE